MALLEIWTHWSAVGAEIALLARTGLKPLEYTNAPAKIPNYPAGKSWGTMGNAFDQMQLPLSPEESAKHIVTLPGFEAKLWAADPEITKPICMAWDERGRLWIAETVDYPNELQRPGAGRDRIKICEDTDGDGKADTFTVFADKLSIPTGLVRANGGVIVIEGGQTLFLKDTNGDGVADERRVLFRGWGMGDTHATASSLRWGLDNWIWGTVGYSGFDGEVGGRQIKFTMGVFRFKPDGSALEFVRSSNNNTWGLGLSEEGIVFGSTANNNASWYMPIPNRYYEAVNGWSASRMETIADSQLIYPITAKVRQVDAHGRYTAGAGHALYTARNYPREYWNRVAFVTEPTGHLIGKFRLEGRGADFVATNEHSFLASDDEWTAPIMAEVGPDGAVWVIDWYKYIVQHNPTPAGFKTGRGNAYESPLRDKRHGRIYRVVYTGAGESSPGAAAKAPKDVGASKSGPRLDFRNAGPQQLVAALRHDNMLWRMHAQRLLVERGQRDAVPALLELARETGQDELGLNTAVIHALWTLQGLGALDGSDADANAVAVAALKHSSAGVRRNAAAVLPRGETFGKAILASDLLNDPDAQVRLSAFLALAEMPPSDQIGAAVLAGLKDVRNGPDRWIGHAATSAAARHDAGFIKAALADQKLVRERTDPLPVGLGAAVRIVTGHYAQRGPVESVVPALLALPGASPALAQPLLDGLAAGWPKEKVPDLTAEDEAKLVALMPRLPEEARSSLLALAERWGKRSLFSAQIAAIARGLRAQVADAALPDAGRVDAARRLIGLDDQLDSVQVVLAQINPLSTPVLAAGLIAALGESRQPQTGLALVGALGQFTPGARRAAIALLLRRPEWAMNLLAAVEKRDLQRTDLGAEHWAQLKGHPDKQVAARAREQDMNVSLASNPDMELVIKKLAPIAQQKGDAQRGKEVFTATCAVCHTFDGQGAKVGPDLTGVGARSRADILVEIIDPNRSVEANYRLWNVNTKDGETFSGRLDTETATSIEIFDTAGQKHAIQRKDIREMSASNLSIMPAGFDLLPPADLAALLEYLAQAPHQEAKKEAGKL